MTLKTAIVGTGAIAYCHADALVKLGAQIAGVYDIVPENAVKLASACGSKPISKLEDVLDEVDAVHLCTPPSFRIPYAEKAMAAGKHVFSEKPMAITVEDAETLVDLAAKHGVLLMVGFNHRFREGFRMLEKTYRSGALGGLTNVFVYRLGKLGMSAGTSKDTWRTNPALACGMTIESLSHDLDMLFQIAGCPSSVLADVRATIEGVPQFDNNVNAMLTFGNGATGLIHASWSSHLKYSMRGIIGSKGTALIYGSDNFDFTEFRIRTDAMEHEEVTMLGDIYKFVGCPSYYNENRHFIECIEKGISCESTGEYALGTLKASHAMLESAKSGRSIALR